MAGPSWIASAMKLSRESQAVLKGAEISLAPVLRDDNLPVAALCLRAAWEPRPLWANTHRAALEPLEVSYRESRLELTE